MIKSFIKTLLKKKGFSIKPYDEYIETLSVVEHDWLKKKNIKTVIDIGAGHGQYSKKLKAIFTDIEIFSFEALPEQYEELLKNHGADSSKHHFYNILLSNKSEEITFFKSSNLGSSSMLNMDNNHKEAYPESSNLSPLKLQAQLLDDVLGKRDLKKNILLKLDVQGAEKKVLEGAKNILAQSTLIFIELSFIKLYEGQPLINEMIDFLQSAGFALIGIDNVSHDLRDGKYLQCDAYFEKR